MAYEEFLVSWVSESVLRSRSFFFTGYGSFSYKNRLKSSKTNVFAFTSSHRLRLRPKSIGSDRLRLRNTALNGEFSPLIYPMFTCVDQDPY